jgi:Domain of unknown function (DUF4082)/PEP-CTERM motif
MLQPIRTLACLLALAAPAAVLADTPALSFTGTNGSFLDGNSRMIGWQFSLTDAVQVTALGWYDRDGDGLNRAHEVGIWEVAGQALVAQATVLQGTASNLDAGFRWAGLAAPVSLQAGISYRIAGLDVGAGGDAHVWDAFLGGYNAHVNGFAALPQLQLSAGAALGGLAGSFGFPTGLIGDSRAAAMGPNFAVSAVPEPASGLLLLGGAALLAGRARRRTAAA